MSQFQELSINRELMDIRLSKEMKALLLDMMSYSDSHERTVYALANWIIGWDDHSDWPNSKVVKDTLRLYKHLDYVTWGTNSFVVRFVEEMNKAMEWSGVNMVGEKAIE